MSSSATDPTSTTASSPNSASSAVQPTTYTDFGWDKASYIGRGNTANSVYVESAGASTPVEVVACGALAGHIREIASRRGWRVTVRPLPAALHNRPQRIKSHVERAVNAAQVSGAEAVIAYADCGTYGALDDLTETTGAKRLPGLHCYDLYVGEARIEQFFAGEPGTYLLTDYLIKAFDRAVIQPLGLDRHPELWTDYFGHYTRLVWLAQQATPGLEEAATSIASRFNLPLTRIDTGTTGLEAALAPLIEMKGPQRHE